MVGQVVFSSEIENYLNNLIYVRYQNEYFGQIEDSFEYVEKLVRFIERNIQQIPSRKSPQNLESLGENYIIYQSSPRTTWYIFYDNFEHNVLVTFLFNNHEKFAQYLDL